MPVFAPFNLVSGGVVRTVSGCSSGRCGQRCGRIDALLWNGLKAAPQERLYRSSDCQISQVILSGQGSRSFLHCHSMPCPERSRRGSEAESKNPSPLSVNFCAAVDKDFRADRKNAGLSRYFPLPMPLTASVMPASVIFFNSEEAGVIVISRTGTTSDRPKKRVRPNGQAR